MAWLKDSPFVRAFLGTLVALAVVGLVWTAYQDHKNLAAVVAYLNAQIVAQQQAGAPPK